MRDGRIAPVFPSNYSHLDGEQIVSDVELVDVIPSNVNRNAVGLCWVCPGAGFAAVGRAGLAWLSFAANMLVYTAFFAAYHWLSSSLIWLFIVALGIAGVLWIAEQSFVGFLKPLPPGPKFLTTHIAWGATLIWGVGFVMLALLFGRFSVCAMYANGMSPALVKGERLLCDRWSGHSIQHGDVIEFTNGIGSTWGEPGLTMIARVIAIPEDTLFIRDGQYMVNKRPIASAAPLQGLRSAIDIPNDPEQVTVPADAYFVIQDSSNNPFDSRIFGWIKERQVKSTRLYRFRWPDLLVKVQ